MAFVTPEGRTPACSHSASPTFCLHLEPFVRQRSSVTYSGNCLPTGAHDTSAPRQCFVLPRAVISGTCTLSVQPTIHR